MSLLINLRLKNKQNNINFWWLNIYKYLFNTLISQLSSSYDMTTLWTYTNIINQFVTTKSLSVYTLNNSQIKKQYFNEWNNAWVREDLVVTRISKAQLNVKSNEIPLFMFYLTFANTMGDLSYAIHAAHRSLFITPMGTWHAPYLNISKVHQKWTHSHSFIFNLFFSQSPILIFANKSLKNEVYAANWSYRIMNYELFKYMVLCYYTIKV